MREQNSLGDWLKRKMHEERLSYRGVAARTDLSHGTIRDIIRGVRPLPATIRKLAHGFGGDSGLHDHLLVLAGYRTQQPSEADGALAELIDKVKQLDDRQIRILTRLVGLIMEVIK